METYIITNYVNYKGGINNMTVCHVMHGFLTLAQFHGKNARKSAEKWKRRFDSGLTPNEFTDY